MDYRYGTGADEIDPFFRTKRSWSKVKDKIVGDYIVGYLKIVPQLRRPILIVDAFAGPGRFGDGSDGSPLIICNAIGERHASHAPMSCIFSDAHPAHRAALTENLATYIASGMCAPPYADCAEAIAHALELGMDSTVFFYLDPFGIKELEFEMVRPIYDRDTRHSTEALINFSFRTFMRMSGNWNYADSASEISAKVKQGKIETLNRVMGGDYWRGIITDPSLDGIAREDALMNAYRDRVREYLPHAYTIPVKEQTDDYTVPGDELAHYHLIFATRSPRAVVLMNDVARNALEPYLRQFKDGLLFDLTPERYQSADRNFVKTAIVDSVRARPLTRPDIYDAVIPEFFMHYRVKDYRAMIDELVFEDQRLYPDRRAMRRPRSLNNDVRLSVNPWT
jgi:three-Cys-motif partner protein